MPNLVNDFEVRKETLRALGGDPTGLSNIYEVDLEILKLIGGIEPGIPDAPIDGVQYARQNGEWTPVESGVDWNTIKQKLAEDGVEAIKFTMGNEEVILTASEVKNLLNQTVLPDAPSNGQKYARQDGNWTVVTEGITDSPSDGKTYGRNNGAWTPVKEGISDAPSDGQQYARQNGEWTPVQTPTEGKYITITADESNTGETIIHPNIEGSLPNLNLQYRINNEKWNDFIVGTTADIKIGAGDVLQFKGDNKEGVSTYGNNLNFGISGNPVAISGNIMSLIDGVGDALEIPNEYCFHALFRNSAIKTVSSDFLPATTLKSSCYRDLFSGCQNLTQAPELPATTLVDGCYNGMFYNCASLVTAPVLPAKTLVGGCYGYMFTYCNSLNYVKCLATEGTINGDGTVPSALDNWLNGVASTGTFEKLSGVSYEAGGNGLPEGWTVKEIYDYVEAPLDGNQYARQNGTWTVVESGISDSPSDGKQYARQNGAWAVVEKGITDSPSDGKTYGRNNGAWTEVETGISDSPSDGKQYARQDGAWTEVETGITDSPSDGKTYGRNNGAWTEVETGITDSPSDGKTYGRNNGAWTVVTEGITDSPSDGKQYARQDGNWAVVEKGITDSPSDGKQYARQDGNWAVVEGITDSPSDGKQYARQDGNWTVVTEGITDSPSDGKQYARQNGAWAVVEKGILDAPIDGVQYSRKNGEWTPVDSGIDWNTIKQKLAEDGVESIKFIIGNEQVILTASEVKTLLNQTVLPEAPLDGQKYARKNAEWTPVEEGIHEAPLDGQQYSRQNGNWTPVEEGIADAPSDGKQYSRKDGVWVEAEPSKVKTTKDTTLQFWSGTQQEYDAIATKDANILYIIS